MKRINMFLFGVAGSYQNVIADQMWITQVSSLCPWAFLLNWTIYWRKENILIRVELNTRDIDVAWGFTAEAHFIEEIWANWRNAGILYGQFRYERWFILVKLRQRQKYHGLPVNNKKR